MNLPPYDKMKIRQENGKTMVLDILRRRYVRLTPEEMVRQCFINFLVEYKGYPTALIGNEVQLSICPLAKRNYAVTQYFTIGICSLV